jgi:hypothetical protein
LKPLPHQCFLLKEFWKWPKWLLLFARASNLGGYYNHKHVHLSIYKKTIPKKKSDKTNGYFPFGGVVYLAIVGCVVYVNSGEFNFDKV